MPQLKIAADTLWLSGDKRVTFDIGPSSEDSLRQYIERAGEYFNKQSQPVRFNVTLDYFVPKASKNAIGLYWRFCSALAVDNQITTDQMHEALKELYVEKVEHLVYHPVRKREGGWILKPSRVLAPKHLHDLDRREFSFFLEQVVMNVLESDNAHKVYYEWQQWKFWQGMQEKPLEYDSHDDYKNRTLACEACGAHLGPANETGGSLGHIKSRGAGGKDVPSNWLYMCDPDHALWDNGQGRESFLAKYPYLKPKIEKALVA